MEKPPPLQKRLGEVLVGENLVTQRQVDEAVAVQQRDGGFIGQILIQLGYVTQAAVTSCLVKQCKIPHLSLLDYEIGKEVVGLVPEEVCRRYGLLPIDKLGRILTVAMVDPLDLAALEEVRRRCPELRIKPILCDWEHFEHVADRLFARKVSGGATITAQSLGLSASPAAKAVEAPIPAAIPVEEEAPLPPVEQHSGASGFETAPTMSAIEQAIRELRETKGALDAHPVSSSAPAPAPGLTVDELAATMRDTMHEAVTEFGRMMAAHAPAPVPAGPSAEELAAIMRETALAIGGQMRSPALGGMELAQVIRDSVGGAMQETMAALLVSLRAGQEKRSESPSPEQFAELIQKGVGGAMHEAVDALASQLRSVSANTTSASVPDGPAPAQIAELIRDGVGGAMQEAMAAMVVQLRSMVGHNSDQGMPPQAMAEMLQTVRDTLLTHQDAQNARLTQIAEAAMQSVQQTSQLVESSVVADHNRHDLHRAQRDRHASVMPFGLSADGAPASGEQEEADAEVFRALDSEVPLETLTFDNFIPGHANAFTFRLGEAVAAEPGKEYNPFFLYGHVGIGKTHLISAIGNAILANHGGPKGSARVGYVSASHFARRLLDAVRENAIDAFRDNYCHWDVLILDDIQFLGGRVEAQEEFFHIFNVLHQQGRQIIIASDKAPDRLGLLEQRLVSRFAGGIVAELKPPEWETRLKILHRQASEAGADLSDEVLSLIATRVSNDVRKMNGALRKVLAYAKLVGKDLNSESAEEILRHLGVSEAA
jgi:chromosomal replication initiator protein DnaA